MLLSLNSTTHSGHLDANFYLMNHMQSNNFVINKKNLPPIKNVDSLIKLLGVDAGYLDFLIEHGVEKNYYRKDPIPKKNGGERIVYAPNKKLKSLLKRINNKIFSQISFPHYLYGSISDSEHPRDYIRCASVHCKAKILIKIDIQDFFPSMDSVGVNSIFSKFFNFSDEISQILTKLTTYHGIVPQGSPTSTFLANLYFYDVEPSIVSHLESEGFRYTRLIDDITISKSERGESYKYIKPRIIKMITNKGLVINEKKCSEQSLKSSQSFKVHGLCIEEETPKFSKPEILKIRGQVFNILRVGYCNDKMRMSRDFHKFYFSVKGKTTKLKRVNSPEYTELKKLLKRNCDPLPDHLEIKRLNRVISNLSKDYVLLHNSKRYKSRFFHVYFRLVILSKLYKEEADEFKTRLKRIRPSSDMSSL